VGLGEKGPGIVAAPAVAGKRESESSMRVVVAMSGGVDSSVSALLLKEAGHDVVGVFLRNGVEAVRPVGGHGCCGATDAVDAAEVASVLSLPFYALDHAREFGRIVDAFVEAHARGETPNPCVQCNRELKFGALANFARALGAERLATGHYARLVPGGRGLELHRARDRAKDQSYVLATVEEEALARALFPIGDRTKEEVRELARRAGLPVHAKAESQELCFVPTGDHRDLLRDRRPELFVAGVVRDAAGVEVGSHGGAAGFTIGQRRGLGLAFGGRRYVTATDPGTNTVVVGSREELLRRRGRLLDVLWRAPRPQDDAPLRAELQVRAHHRPVGVTARPAADGTVDLELDPPGEALTPGQIGVLYEGDRVLGAGVLAREGALKP
jgi:tRNA-specific 2-thiouridylase